MVEVTSALSTAAVTSHTRGAASCRDRLAGRPGSWGGEVRQGCAGTAVLHLERGGARLAQLGHHHQAQGEHHAEDVPADRHGQVRSPHMCEGT